MIPSKRCDACNKDLYLGATRYTVEIKIVSGFDGYLPETDDREDERERAMETLVENLESMSREDMENEVYQEIALTLCPACRRRFLEQIKELSGEDFRTKPKAAQLLQ